MGFYNSSNEFESFDFCPITGRKAIYDFVTYNPMYDGFEYKLLDVNPNVVIGLAARYLNNQEEYDGLRKYSARIILLIEDCEEPFFSIDSELSSRIKK